MHSLPDAADPDAMPLYAAIARSLSAWEMFEFNLSNMYLMFIGSKSVAALRAYGTIAGFRVRLAMIQEASDVYFAFHDAPELHKRVRQLLRDADSLSHRRNEIAHGVISKAMVETDGERFTLIPSLYNAKKITVRSEFKYEHSSAAIEGFRVKFEAIRRKSLVLQLDIGDSHPRRKKV